MICSNCKKECKETDKFCNNCGTLLEKKSIEPSVKDSEVASEATKENTDETANEVISETTKEATNETNNEVTPPVDFPKENKKKFNKKLLLILIPIILILLFSVPQIINSSNYKKAVEYKNNKEYSKASEIFETLANKKYKDAESLHKYCENMIIYEEASLALKDEKYYEAYCLFGKILGFEDATSKQESCIVKTPSSGVLYKNSEFGGGVSLRIIAPAGSSNVYAKIYDNNKKLIATTFMLAGESATVSLPATTIKINVAYGSKWFGEEDMFGDEGNYQTLLLGNNGTSETTTLQSSYTYTLQLQTTSGGNVKNKKADKSIF